MKLPGSTLMPWRIQTPPMTRQIEPMTFNAMRMRLSYSGVRPRSRSWDRISRGRRLSVEPCHHVVDHDRLAEAERLQALRLSRGIADDDIHHRCRSHVAA